MSWRKVWRKVIEQTGWFTVTVWGLLSLCGPIMILNQLTYNNSVVRLLLIGYMMWSGAYLWGFMEGGNNRWKAVQPIIDDYRKIAADGITTGQENNKTIRELIAAVKHWKGRAERAERRRSNTYEDEADADDN
jgi:hypothetical protein